MLIKLVNNGKLGSVSSIEEDQYITQKKIMTFKCQVTETEFNLTVPNWELWEQQ